MRTITLWSLIGIGCHESEYGVEPGAPEPVPQDTVIPPVAGPDTVTDTFTVIPEPPLDIMFVLDRSQTMDDDTANLADAFSSFITEVAERTSDWRIGVVTNDDGCFNNGILNQWDPDYEDKFTEAVQETGFFGAYSEMLLWMTAIALDRTEPGKCNAGFVRPEAVMHVIAVSDETDHSPQTWEEYRVLYQEQGVNLDSFVFSAVVDVSGCELGAGEYLDMVDATGGVVFDVCQANWGEFAAELGKASAEALFTFPLSSQPDPATLTVTADGTPLPTGWRYEPAANTVVIETETVLDGGAALAITYVAASP